MDLKLRRLITTSDDISTDCLHSIPEMFLDPTFCELKACETKTTIDLIEFVLFEVAESR
jgi:hypothetical protein